MNLAQKQRKRLSGQRLFFFIIMQTRINICSYKSELQEVCNYAASQVVRLIFVTRLKFTLCCDGYLIMIPPLVAARPLNAFSLKETQKQKTRLKHGDTAMLRSVQLALHWSWRWMPDGIYSRRRQLKSMMLSCVCISNQWTPWKHQPAQIRVRNIWASFSPWFWLTCQMWTKLVQRATVAPVWLTFYPAAWHSDTGSPSEHDYHRGQPITSTVRSLSLPCLPFHLFQISLYSFHLSLILSDFISYNHSPLSLPTLLRWLSVGQKAAF